MLNRSPVSAKPHIPARNTSIRTWKSVPTSSKYRHEKISAAVISVAARAAKPAPTGSTENEIPRARPSRGFQPPNQYESLWFAEWNTSRSEMTSVVADTAMATMSSIRLPRKWPNAVSAAAVISGIATGSGARTSISALTAHLAELVRVDGAVLLLHLDREREQQCR